MRIRKTTIVECLKCNKSFSKRIDTLPGWSGNCRNCKVNKLGKTYVPYNHCVDCDKKSYWIKEQDRCKECLIKFRQTEENHPRWKGKNAGYTSLHRWVNKHLGKATHCENSTFHKSTRFHWANVSGLYKRDLTDWKQLCPSCNRTDGVSARDIFVERENQYAERLVI